MLQTAIKPTEEDKQEVQEVTASLTSAQEVDTAPALEVVLSNRG